MLPPGVLLGTALLKDQAGARGGARDSVSLCCSLSRGVQVENRIETGQSA